MPNDVNENRNTIDAAASTEERSLGRVTVRSARKGVAPSVRAASTSLSPIPAHAEPTVRTTTA